MSNQHFRCDQIAILGFTKLVQHNILRTIYIIVVDSIAIILQIYMSLKLKMPANQYKTLMMLLRYHLNLKSLVNIHNYPQRVTK